MKETKLSVFLKTLGPGILFASTAIGVSHLVQSTRAGADYGFALLLAVVLVNLFKFPFFEYGSRYASATGQSLIDGYAQMGRWMLALYSLITLATMFFVCAAVSAVGGGFLHQLLGLEQLWSVQQTTWLLFALAALSLMLGRYRFLDRLIKVIGLLLLLSTLWAIILVAMKGPASPEPIPWDFRPFLNLESPDFLFLIALMGWMPTAVDLSAWNSLWTVERIKESGFKPSLRQTVAEFRLGYWISALLAPGFLFLGAYLLYHSGQELPAGSAAFAGSIIGLYTQAIGAWTWPLIALASFSIMFGTSIAIFDGYARAGERVYELWFPERKKQAWLYPTVVLVVALGAMLVLGQFGNRLRSLVDLATSISFIVAPLIAAANFYLVMKLHPTERPSKGLQILSYLGLLFLVAFTTLYLKTFL